MGYPSRPLLHKVGPLTVEPHVFFLFQVHFFHHLSSGKAAAITSALILDPSPQYFMKKFQSLLSPLLLSMIQGNGQGQKVK